MSRTKPSKDRGQQPAATEAEYKRFAEQFVDLLIDPDKRWLLEYFLSGGFTYALDSWKDLAFDILLMTQGSHLMDTKLLDAALAGDRTTLITYLMDNLHQTRPTKETLTTVLKALNTTELRRSIEEAAGIFKLRRGPNPKIPMHRYQELASRAEQLTPVMLKLLTELQSGTKRTTQELLEFWKEDHPEACSLLLRHLGRVQQALDDPALLKRGRRIKSRAHVLAEALAGSDYDLKFSTSLVRVREARVKPSVAS